MAQLKSNHHTEVGEKQTPQKDRVSKYVDGSTLFLWEDTVGKTGPWY